MNDNEELIVPCVYDKIDDYTNNYAIVYIGEKKSIINKIGKLLLNPTSTYNFKYDGDFVIVTYRNKKGVLNQDGILIQIGYDNIRYNKNHNFFELINNKKIGIALLNGKIVLNTKYEGKIMYGDSLFCARLNDKYGYYNTEGLEVISHIYDSANSFKNGLAKVQLNGKYGIINKKNDTIINISYDYIGEIYNNVCVFGEGGTYVEENLNYYDVEFSQIEYKNGKYGVLDFNNNIIIAPEYYKISLIENFIEGVFYTSVTYDNIYWVEKKKEYKRLFNYNGDILINSYEEIDKISNNLYAVTLKEIGGESTITIIDSCGVIKNNTTFNLVGGYDYKLYVNVGFTNGLCLIKVKNKYGFINENADIVINPVFDSATHFINSYSKVGKGQKVYSDRSGEEYLSQGKFGIIDTYGNEIIPVIYDYIKFSEESCNLNLFEVNLGGKWHWDIDNERYYFDDKGDWFLIDNRGVIIKKL